MFLLRFPISLLLLMYQSVYLAVGQIWANKVRSILTTIGIVIGVASVTAVIAALTGLKANVLAEFESMGTNKIFIRPDWQYARRGMIPWERIRFRPEQFDGLLEHCPSVSAFTRLNGMWDDAVSYNGRVEQNVDVTGIEPDWHRIENRWVTLGRPFSLIDEERGNPVCLVNATTQSLMGLPADPIGQSIMVGKTRFLIVGVVETKTESSMFGEGRTGAEIFLPFSTVRKLNPWSGMRVIANARSPMVSEEATAEIRFFLRGKRQIRPGEPDTFRIETIAAWLEKFRSLSATITAAAAGVVGISLLVGGVGIMNIMLVSVSERTREIGLRKAVGARPSAILLQFLIEAVMLCLFGGLIGVLGGQGLTSILARIPDIHLEKAYIPAWAVFLAFGFSAVVGLVFGIFPAMKAARLDPIDALRHE